MASYKLNFIKNENNRFFDPTHSMYSSLKSQWSTSDLS